MKLARRPLLVASAARSRRDGRVRHFMRFENAMRKSIACIFAYSYIRASPALAIVRRPVARAPPPGRGRRTDGEGAGARRLAGTPPDSNPSHRSSGPDLPPAAAPFEGRARARRLAVAANALYATA